MSTVDKEKLHDIIETIPEEMIHVVYKMINILKIEYAPTIKTGHKGSLAGIWKGSQIDDSIFVEAKESLYPYEN